MKIRQAVRSNLVCGERGDYRDGEPTLELVQELAASTSPSPGTALQVDHVPFAETPLIEGRLRDQHPQRVANTANADLHVLSYNRYNAECRAGQPLDRFLEASGKREK